MAKALFLLLSALLVVAVVADFDFEDDDDFADVEFLKRDPVMQELLMAEKRGSKINKYVACNRANQECWCNRRSRKTVFCHAANV